MVKDFMELRRIQTEIGEVLDRLEHGVVVGTKTPVDVKSVMVKLEAPGSCDECPVEQGCISKSCRSMYCKITWKKIIDYIKINSI